ncbi:hypothetical protein SASPL_141551 [Salvia splendens]|uniref:Shikimate O-hydroxycinnamoyltransferase n=1 Tax=Salvia splendens TaxID=180675 RepID=A0A8X8ZCZ1_SALSN|nr:hypothetical protein SASPL_141551 [Salvia splendens]
MYLGVPREKIATRRLVFDKEKVEMIRKLEASRSEVKDPTRVEAVSALLGRRLRMLDETIDVFNKPGRCVFSSWIRFGLYEADFGWGKPARVCTGSPYMNVVVLMEAPAGDGIEALINVVDDRFFQLLQSNCNKLLGEE